jgi:hypothetical protein
VFLAVVCVIMGFVGTPFAIGLFSIKTSDAYQTATRFLASNEKVKGQIGEILNFSTFPSGGCPGQIEMSVFSPS